jgi:hypothetical protein
LLCPVVCQWQFAACCYVLLCVSDSLQLVVMSCCVSVTVCSLLLCPVVCQWQFAACYVLLCVSDSLQLVIMSFCVSMTVRSLLLRPLFIDCFSVFHLVCLHLSKLYNQYSTFSISCCSCSQSTLNTVTQLWHCVKDCCCVMISYCW